MQSVLRKESVCDNGHGGGRALYAYCFGDYCYLGIGIT